MLAPRQLSVNRSPVAFLLWKIDKKAVQTNAEVKFLNIYKKYVFKLQKCLFYNVNILFEWEYNK